MKHCTLTGRDEGEALGPFADSYPHLVMEGNAKGSVPEQNLHLLDKELLPSISKPKPKSYKYIDEEGKSKEKPESPWLLTYGEYVAYKTQTGGWRIGQYLGDHPDVPKDCIKLRKMNVLSNKVMLQNPRRAVWRYEWQSARGKNVVAELGSPPDKRPRAKNTGSLKQAWELVKHQPPWPILHQLSLRQPRYPTREYS